MTLPFTQRLREYWNETDDNDPVPGDKELADTLEQSGVDRQAAERLATMIEDGFKHSVQVGRQEAHLGDTEEDKAVLYAVLAATLLSLINAAMLYIVHFEGTVF